mmetsp:Transcript_4771/g.8176  ORF Transcript_4771/g.8176 Transcript_4771/m.8176 type:complete len:89 (+) Transcript_4771:598-864(+)
MTSVLNYEWIITLFLTIFYLSFPTIELQIIYDQTLQRNLLTDSSSWSIWFMLLFQLAAIIVVIELTVGQFAVYFEIPGGFWSDLVIYI